LREVLPATHDSQLQNNCTVAASETTADFM